MPDGACSLTIVVLTETFAERWERRTAGPLTVLALLFIAVYAAPILWPGLPAGWRLVREAANIVIWALFGVDYLVRLVGSDDRRRFLRTHLFDLVVLVVLVLPMLRPLRMLAPRRRT